jgi:energy-coupling factor transporter ATP-binding protein EcfA2
MSIDTQIAVRTVGLGKSFGPVHALRDVTLDLESGSVLALLGENGAGKSTFISLVSGAAGPNAGRVDKVDPRLSAIEAAYLEPLSCAIHAVDRGQIRPDDTVVIAGVGSIGLCMFEWARQFDPRRVIAVGTRPLRLEFARCLGAAPRRAARR